MEPYSDPDGRSVARSPESPPHATPPSSPPKLKADIPPRIKTLYFGNSMSSLLEAPESPVCIDFSPQLDKRMTTDSVTVWETLPAFQYTPPESSKTIPKAVPEKRGQAEKEIQQIEPDVSYVRESIGPAEQDEEDEHDEGEAENGHDEQGREDEDKSDKDEKEDKEDDNALFILQPRTYTPVPPAPIPSPRVLATPRPTPEEISIRIELEADEVEEGDWRSEECLRESAIIIPQGGPRATPSPNQHSRPLQVNQRQSAATQEPDAQLSYGTSLRGRVSLKIELPMAIHVPPVNTSELQHPRYPIPQGTPQESPRIQRPSGPAYGLESDRITMDDDPNYFNNHVEFGRPAFPNLIPSPASEHQYFRPVQASPHSPLQQRPHTAGTFVNKPGYHQRNVPSQMGMSMLSNVTTMTHDTTITSRTGTVKKKRSAFGWLKKAFSLDEEERAAFEARRRQQHVDQYHERGSPRYLDGKRLDRPSTARPTTAQPTTGRPMTSRPSTGRTYT